MHPITVDKNAAYSPAIDDLKQDKLLSKRCQYRASKYLNNRIEQDHRFIKRRVKPGLGFASYQTAWRTLQGYEAMNTIRKGQVKRAHKHDIQAQNQFIAELFGLPASYLDLSLSVHSPNEFFATEPLLLLIPSYTLVILSMLLFHTAACSGDVSLLNIVWMNRDQYYIHSMI